jgi:hypothetical protein
LGLRAPPKSLCHALSQGLLEVIDALLQSCDTQLCEGIFDVIEHLPLLWPIHMQLGFYKTFLAFITTRTLLVAAFGPVRVFYFTSSVENPEASRPRILL